MKNSNRAVQAVCVAAALMVLGACATKSDVTAPKATPTAIAPTPMPMPMPAAVMTLSSAQEVPPNPSTATGQSTIAVGADKTVTGSVRVTGMAPTMAHIHEAVRGANGPVIVPFVKTAENTFAPAPGAKLTDAQYASYLAGKLYVNVHSATYPGGEVRVQLMPAK